MKLYYHKTDGGAEYLCSSPVEGTNEGSFDSKYIVRIDGDITKDAELNFKDNPQVVDFEHLNDNEASVEVSNGEAIYKGIISKD
jgi:hypothetical protein